MVNVCIVQGCKNSSRIHANEASNAVTFHRFPNDPEKDAFKAVKLLMGKGCGTVIVTLGEGGAVYYDLKLNKCIHVPTDTVKTVDTTGAGDAFIGALATYISKTPSETLLHQIIGAACRVATLSVMKEGTQTSYPDGFDAFAKQYQYNVLDD